MNVWGISGTVTDSTGGLIVLWRRTADVPICYVTALANWEVLKKEFSLCIHLRLALSLSLFPALNILYKSVSIRKY